MKTLVTALILGTIALATTPARPATPLPAITVPLEERHNSGVRGNVELKPQGKMTAVHVTMLQGLGHGTTNLTPSLSVHTGADCINGPQRASSRFALNPITGKTSHTVIDVPISALHERHFVVDVRNATSTAQAADACARL